MRHVFLIDPARPGNASKNARFTDFRFPSCGNLFPRRYRTLLRGQSDRHLCGREQSGIFDFRLPSAVPGADGFSCAFRWIACCGRRALCMECRRFCLHLHGGSGFAPCGNKTFRGLCLPGLRVVKRVFSCVS